MPTKLTNYADECASEILGATLYGTDTETHWDEKTFRCSCDRHCEEFYSGFGTIGVTADSFSLEVAGAKVSGQLPAGLEFATAEHINGDEVDYSRDFQAYKLLKAINAVCGMDMLVAATHPSWKGYYFPHTEGR